MGQDVDIFQEMMNMSRDIDNFQEMMNMMNRSLSINVQGLKENKPEVYEEYKLLFVLAGATDERNELGWSDIEKYGGLDQTRDLFNKVSNGHWDRRDLIIEEKDKEKQKIMMEQIIEEMKRNFEEK